MKRRSKPGGGCKGKLHKGYFWPLYGDQDEVAFPFAASRAQAVVREALGKFCGVLLTDGYIVYELFAQKVKSLVPCPMLESHPAPVCRGRTGRAALSGRGARPH